MTVFEHLFRVFLEVPLMAESLPLESTGYGMKSVPFNQNNSRVMFLLNVRPSTVPEKTALL